MTAIFCSRMHSNFRRWQAKDQPAIAHINMRALQGVEKKFTIFLRIGAVDNKMCAVDHDISFNQLHSLPRIGGELCELHEFIFFVTVFNSCNKKFIPPTLLL